MAFNYGQRPETIKITTETQDDDPKVMRNFIRPINCVATGDTIIWDDAGEQTTTYKVLNKIKELEKDRHDCGYRQRVFSKHVTIFDLEADDPDMPHCVAKVTYDSFMEKETIEILPIDMIEESKKGKRVKEMAHTVWQGVERGSFLEAPRVADAFYDQMKYNEDYTIEKSEPSPGVIKIKGKNKNGWETFGIFINKDRYSFGFTIDGKVIEKWEGNDYKAFCDDLDGWRMIDYQLEKGKYNPVPPAWMKPRTTESKKKVRESKVRAGGENLPHDYKPTTAESDLADYVKTMFNQVLKESLPMLDESDRFKRDACGCFVTPEFWYVVAYCYNSGYSMSIINDAGKVDYSWEGSTKEEFDTDLEDVHNTLKQILKVEYDHMERNPEFRRHYEYKRNFESHLKTKHIKESIVEEGIASFLKWLREENFITPIEERDFMDYLKHGRIEEQDVDIIYDIGTDYNPETESNENFERCANIIKSYVDQSGYQYCSKETDKTKRVQEGFHGHTFKINWEMLDQEGSDRLTDLLIDAVAWKNEDEDYQTQEKFELTFNRKFEELKKRGLGSNEAAPRASNYALFTIFPRDDEEASDIINDYLFSGACRDEEDQNLLHNFVSDEGEESSPEQGLPTDKYDLGPWTDPAYESKKRSKKTIKEMARVNDFDLSPYDLRNQIKDYVRERLIELVGKDKVNYNFKINQPKWDMVYDGSTADGQFGPTFAIRTQGEDYYMSTFLNSLLKWQGKGFEEFKEDFEDLINSVSNKDQIREAVSRDSNHCYRVFNMAPEVAEKLESLASEDSDWMIQFNPRGKNYFILTTNEIKSKDQLRKLIAVDASYQVELLF